MQHRVLFYFNILQPLLLRNLLFSGIQALQPSHLYDFQEPAGLVDRRHGVIADRLPATTVLGPSAPPESESTKAFPGQLGHRAYTAVATQTRTPVI